VAIGEVSEGYSETSMDMDTKGSLHHYQRTAILNELDNKSAVLTGPSHGVN
jgi:hypothetical protein